MDFDDLLRLMVEKKGSDLFITTGVPPSMKINGRIMPVTKSPLTGDMVRQLILGIMNEKQKQEYLESRECNFAIVDRGQTARFRVSAFYQRDLPGMILRRIENVIPTWMSCACQP